MAVCSPAAQDGMAENQAAAPDAPHFSSSVRTTPRSTREPSASILPTRAHIKLVTVPALTYCLQKRAIYRKRASASIIHAFMLLGLAVHCTAAATQNLPSQQLKLRKKDLKDSPGISMRRLMMLTRSFSPLHSVNMRKKGQGNRRAAVLHCCGTWRDTWRLISNSTARTTTPTCLSISRASASSSITF